MAKIATRRDKSSRRSDKNNEFVIKWISKLAGRMGRLWSLDLFRSIEEAMSPAEALSLQHDMFLMQMGFFTQEEEAKILDKYRAKGWLILSPEARRDEIDRLGREIADQINKDIKPTNITITTQ